jgi:cytochrome P450
MNGDHRVEPGLREPYVFPLSESPFSPEVPPLERRRRVLAVGADVVTDELGLVVDFMSEADVDAVLNDPRFAAVGMPTLALSDVHDGPLFDLWSELMFTKDADQHHRIRAVVARDFAPKAVEKHRPAIDRIAGELSRRRISRRATPSRWRRASHAMSSASLSMTPIRLPCGRSIWCAPSSRS